MSTFWVVYYHACLFVSGLAVAAVVRFAGARLMMAVAAAPLFVTALLLALAPQAAVSYDLVAVPIGFSMMVGLTAFALVSASTPGAAQRRAWAALLLLLSPALLAFLVAVSMELLQIIFRGPWQLAKL